MKKRKGLAYIVSADTREVPGRLSCVSVELDRILLSSHEHMRVDLADHPLYPHLQEYVLDNPRPRLPVKGAGR